MGSLALLCVLGAIVCATPLQVAAQDDPRPIRTFSHFAGTWTLDEAASTGRLTLAPLKITIETAPAEIKVTKQQGPRYTQRFPPPEIYRMDGTETVDDKARPRAVRRFTLVADMLALTTRNDRPGSFTLQTEAFARGGRGRTDAARAAGQRQRFGPRPADAGADQQFQTHVHLPPGRREIAAVLGLYAGARGGRMPRALVT